VMVGFEGEGVCSGCAEGPAPGELPDGEVLGVGVAEVDFGVVKPGWMVKAYGGSKIPLKLTSQPAHSGTNLVTIFGMESWGVQVLVW